MDFNGRAEGLLFFRYCRQNHNLEIPAPLSINNEIKAIFSSNPLELLIGQPIIAEFLACSSSWAFSRDSHDTK